MNLEKGQNINLEKESPNVTQFTVGLGWDVGNASGFDLDASLLVKDENDKVLDLNQNNVVYFHNKNSVCGSVIHSGDNRTGEGKGDDETIKVDFSKMPENAQKLSVVINIYKAEENNQNFGQVNNAYARVFETETNKEVAKYDLTEDYSTAYAIHVVDFYKKDGSWKFKAVGEGSKKSLSVFIKEAGIN